MKLYIIGNGFDCHHKLNTTYSSYRKYLSDIHPEIALDYERFPYLSIPNSPWSDIEKALMIDYRSLMQEKVNYAYPDGIESKNGMWLNIDLELHKSTEFINGFTGKYFAEWLNSINYDEAIADLNLSKDNIYLNFNYTDSLQKLYGIENKNILHIHGQLSRIRRLNDISVRKELQFGAVGISAKDIEKELIDKYRHCFLSSLFIKPAIDVLCEFIHKSTKNLNKNFAPLIQFIETKDVEEVIVMGHKLDGADIKYYEHVLIPSFKNKAWIFYRYGGKNSYDAAIINDFINKHTLKNTCIIDW